MSKSKSGHILYLMVHFPFIWWWKIGITGKSADARAKQVDKAVFGFPVPVMVVFIPGAYFIEQDLHRRFSFLQNRFYKGDGASEWFLFPVAFFMFPFMLAIWAGYVAAIDLILGTRFFELAVDVLKLCLAWIQWGLDFVF